mgnify:CR=1 FL=1
MNSSPVRPGAGGVENEANIDVSDGRGAVSGDGAVGGDGAGDNAEPVGYGHPPRHTRFKSGCSGNPKGRPKGARSFKRAAAEMLNEHVSVRGKNGSKRMRTREAIYRALRELGFKGNLRALERMIELDRMLEEIEEAKAFNAKRQDLTKEDKEYLRWGLSIFTPGELKRRQS